MSKIFVSYAKADTVCVKRIVTALEKKGFTVFWDKSIRTGESWRGSILRELAQADKVLVVWSANSVHSKYVIDEAENANKRDVLFPIRIDDVDPPLGQGDWQMADLSNWNGSPGSAEFRKLIDDLSQSQIGASVTGRESNVRAVPPTGAKGFIWGRGYIPLLSIFTLIALGVVAMMAPFSEVSGTETGKRERNDIKEQSKSEANESAGQQAKESIGSGLDTTGSEKTSCYTIDQLAELVDAICGGFDKKMFERTENYEGWLDPSTATVLSESLLNYSSTVEVDGVLIEKYNVPHDQLSDELRSVRQCNKELLKENGDLLCRG